MALPQQIAAPASGNDSAAEGATRLLVLGGMALILAGMLLGDIFAAFILHPNADRIGGWLSHAATAVAAQDRQAVAVGFTNLGEALENRGTKVDAHLHIIALGY